MQAFESTFENLDMNEIRDDLTTVGWTILGDSLSSESCSNLKGEIDSLANDDGVEVNYGGTEHRVWKAHEKSEHINSFRLFSDKVLSEVEGEDKEAFDILAIRNRKLPTDDNTLRKGRWHLDSFRKQLKIFLFLTDVSDDTGPFEMIPGTHRTSLKLKEAIKGNLITVDDLRKGTRKYQHLEENVIDKILSKGFENKAFNVKAGTLALVDTSSIHRARPCAIGERYALTSYYA